MKKLFAISLAAAFALALCACTGSTAAPSSPPSAAPTAHVSQLPLPSQTVPESELPSFVRDCRFDLLRQNADDGDSRLSAVRSLSTVQANQLKAALATDGWRTVDSLPAEGFELFGVFSDVDGNELHLAPWDESVCLVSCYPAQGGVLRYWANASALDAVKALSGTLTELGRIDALAEEYFDLFWADSALTPLICLAPEGGDGSFSDDQLAAYAIHALALTGAYDHTVGLSKDELDDLTMARFGRTIQNYDNSMSRTLPSGRVTATGWSFDCGVFLVLSGDAPQADQDGALTARFKCYILPDSLWLDEELPAEKRAHFKEYLLTGNGEGFPAPLTAELTFRLQTEAAGEAQVTYQSLKLLP